MFNSIINIYRNNYYYSEYLYLLDDLDENRQEYAIAADKMINLNDYINIFTFKWWVWWHIKHNHTFTFKKLIKEKLEEENYITL